MSKPKIKARTGDRHTGQQFTMRFDAEERALLDRLGERLGGKKTAVVAGLRVLDRAGEPSKEELLALIARRLK